VDDAKVWPELRRRVSRSSRRPASSASSRIASWRTSSCLGSIERSHRSLRVSRVDCLTPRKGWNREAAAIMDEAGRAISSARSRGDEPARPLLLLPRNQPREVKTGPVSPSTVIRDKWAKHPIRFFDAGYHMWDQLGSPEPDQLGSPRAKQFLARCGPFQRNRPLKN
jgi:hypothetical protein